MSPDAYNEYVDALVRLARVASSAWTLIPFDNPVNHDLWDALKAHDIALDAIRTNPPTTPFDATLTALRQELAATPGNLELQDEVMLNVAERKAHLLGRATEIFALKLRLEAADALAEALRLTEDYLDHIGACETKWACPDCGKKRSRAYDARFKALAAYDAAKKGEADGHR